MDGNLFSNENNNNKELNELKNESTENKLRLRKRNIYEVLGKKKNIVKDNEVDNKILNELPDAHYSVQIEQINKMVTSNNEQNIIKALQFINDVICPKQFI